MRRALALMAAAALVPAAAAVANSDVKVTGGGQVMADSGNGGGPGDTIAFNAQQTGAAAMNGTAPAKGQLQVVRHPTGGIKFHGNVTCIRELGDQDGTVRFGGFQKLKGNQTATSFVVDVVDAGEPNQGQDMIAFRTPADNADPCQDSKSGTQLDSASLARGNVQTH